MAGCHANGAAGPWEKQERACGSKPKKLCELLQLLQRRRNIRRVRGDTETSDSRSDETSVSRGGRRTRSGSGEANEPRGGTGCASHGSLCGSAPTNLCDEDCDGWAPGRCQAKTTRSASTGGDVCLRTTVEGPEDRRTRWEELGAPAGLPNLCDDDKDDDGWAHDVQKLGEKAAGGEEGCGHAGGAGGAGKRVGWWEEAAWRRSVTNMKDSRVSTLAKQQQQNILADVAAALP